ncbi:MAG: SEC-C domain-containing protein, partial [Solirubrobacteraceae bacterium]|nr:SEC-C domain-containing protein [Solirubrobacteraceae bacterium]
LVREDQNDQIYKTKDGKWSAVAREIEARHEVGQPVLVGTVSVEISELLGSMLAQRGIPHTVLNAKPEYAEREGEIIAEAGRPGAVTIATNMAGRGVDIKLGGSPEHLAREELIASGVQPHEPEFAEKMPALIVEQEAKVADAREEVLESGGLFIVGTERHESRRIDNQLRGRAGRQGDPGESRFFLSAEDDLVRLFAGDRIYKILDRLGGTDEEGNEEPIEAGMLSKQIEKAQRKVEEQNFLIRKRVLEYDDVMNEQRRVVYAYRDEVLEGADLGEQARTEIGEVASRLVEEYTPSDYVEDWDLSGLFVALTDIMPVGTLDNELTAAAVLASNLDRETLSERVVNEAMALYDGREEELGDELMRALERYLLLQTIDQRWKEHLYDMDYLREGIHLRGFAQIDPLVAYKNEAFTLFGDLMNSIWADFARMVYHVEVEVEVDQSEGQVPFAQAPATPIAAQAINYSSGGGTGALEAAAAGGGVAEVAYAGEEQIFEAEPVEQRVLDADEQIGRNDPCWCGSGQKYKKCHGA